MDMKQELNRRDATLYKFMDDSMKARKEIASELEKEKSKSWWSKLFNN